MLSKKRIVYLVGPEFEDLEFWVPLMFLQAEGAQVTIVSYQKATFRGKHCLEAAAEALPSEISVDDFDGLVVPGGWAPDKLRRYSEITGLVRAFYEQGKIVASICHGGWVLASAGILQGHKATGSTGIRDDLRHAGAAWVDAPAFRDGNLVWGRVVADIPAFCRELRAALADS